MGVASINFRELIKIVSAVFGGLVLKTLIFGDRILIFISYQPVIDKPLKTECIEVCLIV
jgi:hypothetical protein